MNDESCERRQQPGHDHGLQTGRVETAKSASMLPLIILFQRAWELAHSVQTSLARLEHAAEAAALADAVAHLLADAGDQEGYERWSVRLSEARHWCAVVHDALTIQEEKQA
jgi:hypothetical protein